MQEFECLNDSEMLNGGERWDDGELRRSYRMPHTQKGRRGRSRRIELWDGWGVEQVCIWYL